VVKFVALVSREIVHSSVSIYICNSVGEHTVQYSTVHDSDSGASISIEWILCIRASSTCPCACKDETSLAAPKSSYIAAALGNKKISFPFSLNAVLP
jgi:hypothetical protein